MINNDLAVFVEFSDFVWGFCPFYLNGCAISSLIFFFYFFSSVIDGS